MSELIPINYDGEQPTVSARELHKSLEISKRFSAWFETNSQGFIENEDFTSVLSGTVVNNGAHREIQDYSLSVDMAKHICQNGYQIGQKRLFQWMRDNGYLMVSGSSRNMPKQKYVEQGLFEIKESNAQNPDGSVRITRTTKVSGKGQLYFVNKFLGQEEMN